MTRHIQIVHIKIQINAMGVADNFLPGKIYKCTRQQFIMIKVLVCVVSVLRLTKLNYTFITMTQEYMTQLNVFIVKLDWVGPVNNRPSTNKIHHFFPFIKILMFF